MKIITLTIAIIAPLLLSGCKIINTQYDQPSSNQDSQESEVITSKLNLSNKQLNKLPSYVLNLNDLEELDLSNNQLSGALPAEIKSLKKLKILNLSNNLMTGIPAEMGQLSNLQTLNLSNNKLTGLPYELGNLKNLKTLNLAGNDYSKLDLGIILESLPKDINVITQ